MKEIHLKCQPVKSNFRETLYTIVAALELLTVKEGSHSHSLLVIVGDTELVALLST